MQSNKFLVVSVEKDYYACSNSHVCDSKVKAYQYILDETKFYGLLTPFDIRTDDKNHCYFNYGEDKFVVYQIFEIPKNATHVVIYWHACDNVDFELKSILYDKEDAIDEFHRQIDKLKEKHVFNDIHTELSLFVGDDGTEWHTLKVIEV